VLKGVCQNRDLEIFSPELAGGERDILGSGICIWFSGRAG